MKNWHRYLWGSLITINLYYLAIALWNNKLFVTVLPIIVLILAVWDIISKEGK